MCRFAMDNFNYDARETRLCAGELIYIDKDGDAQALVSVPLSIFQWNQHSINGELLDKILSDPTKLGVLHHHLNSTGIINFTLPRYERSWIYTTIIGSYDDNFARLIILNSLRALQ